MGNEGWFGRRGAQPRRMRALLGAIALAAVAGTAITSAVTAQEEEPPRLAIKGTVKGGDELLNPVWNEAKDPSNHRYTFRRPSATVSQDIKRLTAYLPKELPIAVLGGGGATGTVPVHVSGGRTTPVTTVISPQQNVQLINDDPFVHRIYTVDAEGGLAPEDMKPKQQRTWQPPGPGAYEIRDELFPSVRSWIVVEPKVVATGYPNTDGDFVVRDLPPGSYTVQAYFTGKPQGEAMPFEVQPFGEVQPLPKPLVVAGEGGSTAQEDTEGAGGGAQ